MTVLVLQGDARRIPLPDNSVDLVVTSPPYFGLRSYTDGGEHYDGQIGSEQTPAAYVEALVACTREWVRVLKPSGSLFINLGDKYAGSQQQSHGRQSATSSADYWQWSKAQGQPKSLLGLPWRYALAVTDQLGLILRAEIIWAKPNGLPESVTDRVRRAHEQVFHFTVRPRYYSAVDEIREQYAPGTADRYRSGYGANSRALAGATSSGVLRSMAAGDGGPDACNPLGKLPGSVWSIPSQPLTVPPHLGVDHFAAFPMELPRRLILGWSPPGVCTGCGEGRRPVAARGVVDPAILNRRGERTNARSDFSGHGVTSLMRVNIKAGEAPATTITGYACSCVADLSAPELTGVYDRQGQRPARGGEPDLPGRETGGRPAGAEGTVTTSPAGESLPPTRPAVVLDPFGGTGTTALLAHVNGRHGITVDRSADYCRIARWRTQDPGERARAMQVDKPAPVHADQQSLFDIA